MTHLKSYRPTRRKTRQANPSFLQLLITGLLGLPRIDPLDDQIGRATHQHNSYRNPNLW